MKVILSAEKSGNTPTANDIATKQLAYVLRNYGYTNQSRVLGKYNGVTETSIVLDGVANSDIDEIACIASMFRQECILIERDDAGYLKSCEHPQWPLHCLGTRRVSTTVPDVSQDYTYYPDTQQYVRYV
jgi:hypothetical protein